MNVNLAVATAADLPPIHAIEQGDDIQKFVFAYTLKEHEFAYASTDITYLKIIANDELAGYFILREEPELNRVEFRRLAIKPSIRGIGQQAIKLMEAYCVEDMGYRLIWLDVYADNPRAIHIYEKLGYTRIGHKLHNDRDMYIYQKDLVD